MNKTILLLTGVAAFGMSASAATLCLNGTGVTDVAANTATGLGPSSGNVCDAQGASPNSTAVSPLLFNNFTVNPSAGFVTGTIGISNGPTTSTQYCAVIGSTCPAGSVGNTYLDLQFGGITGPGAPLNGDLLLQYQESSGVMSGIGISFQATPGGGGGNITVTEKVCTVAFVNNVCNGTTLANIVATSNGSAAFASAVFAAQHTPVYILKDIQFNNATTSEIVNSHLATIGVPEPMTVSLIGMGLLGLGFVRRARKK